MKIKTILLFSIILFSLLNLVSAGFSCGWDTYGSNYNLMPNYQYYNLCSSLFNQTNITTLTYGSGQSYNNTKTAFQPLVADLGQEGTPLLIFPNNNYLQLYDTNLNLVTEILIGQKANSQIDVGDLDGNGLVNDIAGIFYVNATNFAFRIYTYNSSTQLLTKHQEINFSGTGNDFGTNGLRCEGGNNGNYGTCYSVWYYTNGTHYLYNFIKFYGNGTYNSYQIGSGWYYGYPREPLSWTDWDNDGINEFLVWSDKSIIVFNGNNGAEEKLITTDPTNSDKRIRYAKFFVPLQTTTLSWIDKLFGNTATNQRLIYTMETGNTMGCGSGTYYGLNITSIKSDGSGSWSQCYGTTTSTEIMRTYGLAIADYNGDLKDDVWIVYGQSGLSPTTIFKIFKGEDGSSLYSQNTTPFNYAGSYPNTDLILSRLDNDAIPDFLVHTPNKVVVWSPTKNQQLFANSTITPSACISADLSYDGLQDIICTSSTSTTMFTPNYQNQNPTISSVTYDPATIVSANSPLNIIITAYDPENDPIQYSHQCSASDSWSENTYSSTQTCIYTSAGYFNSSIRIKDIFHTDNYTTFSQTILVTSTGTACNNNGVCEAGLSETYITCPSDCPAPPSQPAVNTTQTDYGGSPIPTKIVDTENTEQGLLPEIYYGILGFLSGTLSPMILLVFVIFFVLIMLTIGVIIKKIAHKVGDLR